MSAKTAEARGKFLFIGPEKYLVRGVSYGTFEPDGGGSQFPESDRVARDFAAMRNCGINTIRTYTGPPPAVLDLAAEAGLRLIVGVPWTQHVAFLDEPQVRRDIRTSVVSEIRRLRHHPAILMFALGNEIPAAVVRWHGHARTEQFIRALYDDAKAVSPDSLFTYVNFPPTEYLDLPFVDVCAFNVYLHRETELRSYLARLQHIAGHRPLLLAEAGADSIREGLEGQAALTAMQLRAAYREGACGAIAFAWTDEWWRGGSAVEDWAFGMVDRERRPKPAAAAVARVFGEVPFPAAERREWPRVSVVVCAYNAADTLDECLTSVRQLRYPEYELIVINDGSTDDTGAVARRHASATVIDTPNNGLSAARNAGLDAATGSIVAYTDADVRVDPDWLAYLVQPLLTEDVIACGGPNVVPLDDPWVAQCVARAPGGPTHVLLDDRIAEHVPGCNFAVQRSALAAIGGFNPVYRRAGDDVDVCWRLQARGWKIGFAPAAFVWHRHRASMTAYWRQQVGYGEGEAWLAQHHDNMFAGGSIRWRGHIYSSLPFVRALSGTRVNAGPWGTAPFPSVYRTDALPYGFLPHSVLWQVTALALSVAGGILSVLWPSTVAATMLAAGLVALTETLIRCVKYALASDIRAIAPLPGYSPVISRLLTRTLIAALHLVQPFARGAGRWRGTVGAAAPKAARGAAAPCGREIHKQIGFLWTRRKVLKFWSERWISREELLTATVSRLRATRLCDAIESDDGWHSSRDVSLQVGYWAWLDLRMLVEEHAGGRVLARVGGRLRFTYAFGGAIVTLTLALLAATSELRFIPVAVALLMGGVVGHALWRTAQTASAADQVLRDVMRDAGMIAMGTTAEPREGDGEAALSTGAALVAANAVTAPDTGAHTPSGTDRPAP